jgi:hypothetical protein
MSNESNVIYPFADPNIKYTMMDNYLFDHIMPVVKPNAWKILCLIIRKTRGWHKATDQISFSQIKAGTGISSDETVNNALKQLVGKGYILATKGGQWDATAYAINTKYSTTKIEVERNTTTKIVAGPTTKIVAGPTTKIVDTKETNKEKDKKTSAEADHSRPVSLLSEKEIKALKLPLSTWQQYLADEQDERGRKGIIKFLKNKIAMAPLLPDTTAAHILFDKLAIEAEAKGRRPAQKFPTLAVKEKFDIAASKLNGTLETAITKALESGITSIPRIVNYISSPKWAEYNNYGAANQNRTNVDRSSKRNEANADRFSPPAGSGQTPEMAAKLRAAFASK